MKLMIQKSNNCETLGMTEAGRSHTIRCVVSGPRNTKRTGFSMAMGGGVDFCCKSCSRLAHWKFGIYTLVAS